MKDLGSTGQVNVVNLTAGKWEHFSITLPKKGTGKFSYKYSGWASFGVYERPGSVREALITMEVNGNTMKQRDGRVYHLVCAAEGLTTGKVKSDVDTTFHLVVHNASAPPTNKTGRIAPITTPSKRK